MAMERNQKVKMVTASISVIRLKNLLMKREDLVISKMLPALSAFKMAFLTSGWYFLYFSRALRIKATTASESYFVQGWLKTWIWQLLPQFLTFIPLWMLVNGANIICLPSKNVHLYKIERLWPKNWDCHALLKFKTQKGMAGLFFEQNPLNFWKMCIF